MVLDPKIFGIVEIDKDVEIIKRQEARRTAYRVMEQIVRHLMKKHDIDGETAATLLMGASVAAFEEYKHDWLNERKEVR